jgi:hypothetical protein
MQYQPSPCVCCLTRPASSQHRVCVGIRIVQHNDLAGSACRHKLCCELNCLPSMLVPLPRPSSAIEKSLLAKGVATVYDPTDDEEIETIEEADSAVRVQPGSSSSSRDTVQGIPTSKLDLSSMSRFLLSPGPQAGPVQCFIERDKGSMGKPPW